MIRTSCFAVLGLALCTAAAAKEPANPYAKTYKLELPAKVSKVYLGGGLANELMHGMAEVPTTYGNFYARVGQMWDGDGVAGQVGYRYPVKYSGTDNNGVYLGVFGGHVEAAKDLGETVNRLGAGFDMAYLWFDETRLSSASVGVYVDEPLKNEDGDNVDPRMKVMVSLDLLGGFF